MLFLNLAQRTGIGGIQQCLSFCFKSLTALAALYPEHDLFLQQTTRKHTLRAIMGKDLRTRPGLDYYE